MHEDIEFKMVIDDMEIVNRGGRANAGEQRHVFRMMFGTYMGKLAIPLVGCCVRSRGFLSIAQGFQRKCGGGLSARRAHRRPTKV